MCYSYESFDLSIFLHTLLSTLLCPLLALLLVTQKMQIAPYKHQLLKVNVTEDRPFCHQNISHGVERLLQTAGQGR